MNKTTEALKLAEEAMTSNMRLLGAKAIAAIREALAEQEKQRSDSEQLEPVAIVEAFQIRRLAYKLRTGTKLYAAPVSTPEPEPKCSDHPDAPHGFNRNMSHAYDRYVCDCEGWEPDEPVQRPQNCGTGYCSCIECPYEPVSIPDHITCPFCESDHVPDWLHDLKLDAKAIRAEALEEAAKVSDAVLGDNKVSAAIRGLK